MKPEQWVIEDMQRLRKLKEKSYVEGQYLELLSWYVKTMNGKE